MRPELRERKLFLSGILLMPIEPAVMDPALSTTPPEMRAEAERSFAVRLMEHLVVPTFVLDPERRVIVWNKACERLTGVPASDVIGTSDHWRAFYSERRPCLADLVAGGAYDQIRSLYAHWNGFAFSDVGVSVENLCMMPKLGRSLYLAIDAGPIYDDVGSLIAVVETVRDITAQYKVQAELENLASTDGLTGLSNRRSFDKALARELQRLKRDGTPLSLLLVDVDHFKAFNDRFGHPAGDAALRAVAKAIEDVLIRDGDQAARYGGEEFAVILPVTDADQARHVAEQIRRKVGSIELYLGRKVTVSVGIATSADQSPTIADLLQAADSALYEAKRQGRNRCSFKSAENAVLF